MREKVKTKRKSDVKEMVYVDGVSRRGKPTLSLQSVSPSPPPITPSPSKSRRSMRGSESPSKRQRIHSPQFYVGNPDDDGQPRVRTTKVCIIPFMIFVDH